MRLQINQEPVDFTPEKSNNALDECTVGQLMRQLYPTSTDGLAVAIADQVIARADWDDTTLQPNDQLLILTATQGG